MTPTIKRLNYMSLLHSQSRQSAKSLNARGRQVDYWPEYKLEPDVASWFTMFMAVAETFPYCLVLSDITIPGNPMFYVNQVRALHAFCGKLLSLIT